MARACLRIAAGVVVSRPANPPCMPNTPLPDELARSSRRRRVCAGDGGGLTKMAPTGSGAVIECRRAEAAGVGVPMPTLPPPNVLRTMSPPECASMTEKSGSPAVPKPTHAVSVPVASR